MTPALNVSRKLPWLLGRSVLETGLRSGDLIESKKLLGKRESDQKEQREREREREGSDARETNSDKHEINHCIFCLKGSPGGPRPSQKINR